MTLRDALKEVLQTAFRLVPWPTEPGLRRIGSPGASSPVLLTGNYDLTVRRLVRALHGRDAWLLVAPSGGINVWCAAMDSVTRDGCKLVLNEVYEGDIERFSQRAEAFFALMPNPGMEKELAESSPLFDGGNQDDDDADA